MRNTNIGTVIRVGTSEAVVIPAAIRRGLKWMRGDVVVFGIYDENTIAIRKLTPDELRNLKPGEVPF